MLAPLHNTLVTAVLVVMPEPGWVMVTVLVVVHPLPSVTVTVITPAFKLLITEVVAAVDHKYVYEPAPPLAITVAAPVLLPKHKTLVTAVDVASAEGWVMVTVFVEVQPEPSVTVTVLTPAFKLLITEVVAAVDHK